MTKINAQFNALVRAGFEQNIATGNAVKKYMDASTAIYHGEPVACLYMPKIFTRRAWEFLQTAAADIHMILEKVIARYLADPAYRTLFGFEPELERLILTDAGYPRLLPIARLDIFFNENDFTFKFCEFNADGASAMNEDREINNALHLSETFTTFAHENNLQSCELFDSWVREFGKIYCEGLGGSARDAWASSPPLGGRPAPSLAIVDFMDAATVNEFVEFQKAFRKAGYTCEICEIRDLIYEGGELKTPGGVKIDAVYRRAVTCDIMGRREEVRAFLQAAADGAVCVIGHFRTQVIHNKRIFAILQRAETLDFLTPYEREFISRHVPETFLLEHGEFDLAEILREKNDWLIKPEDSYGARGVFPGIDLNAEEWAAAVQNATGTGYLLQKYCPPFPSENLDFNASPRPDFKMYNNITGMFVYNGRLAGLYSRAGLSGVISGGTKGMTLAGLVEGKND